MPALRVLDLAPGPHRDLVEALHDLHHDAGWPSLRTLAGAAGCSYMTVSRVFTLVLSVALVRARAVPVPAVAGFVVLTLAQFVMPAGKDVLNYLQIAMMLMLVGFAFVVWRRA
jgi:hypothetical protein